MNDEHKEFQRELGKRGVDFETEAGDTVFTDDRNYRWLVSDMPSVNGDSLAIMAAGLSCAEAANVILGDFASETDDLAVLALDTRTCNALKTGGVHTVGDLMAKSRAELARIRGIGKLTIGEISHTLERCGLSLRETR